MPNLIKKNQIDTVAQSQVEGLGDAFNLKEDKANKGVANGYASLNASGEVPSSQLPSFVDDVLEFANLGSFPATGETGKIYVALDDNKQYRWSGSSYIQITNGEIASTDDVPEGSNLYFTFQRVRDTLLTGLGGFIDSAISAGDNILEAFAKLQGQVNNKVNNTGDETIDGVKTFGSEIIRSSSDFGNVLRVLRNNIEVVY